MNKEIRTLWNGQPFIGTNEEFKRRNGHDYPEPPEPTVKASEALEMATTLAEIIETSGSATMKAALKTKLSNLKIRKENLS